MRSLMSGLIGCALAGLIGSVAVVGCSADGATDDTIEPVQEPTPTDPGAKLPPKQTGDEGAGNTEDSNKADGGKPKDAGKDAAKADAAKDSGPPAPTEGAPCTQANEIFKRSCGFCGQQDAICLMDANGVGVVSGYGDCKNQIDGGCTPGTIEDMACGNCGTQKRTCSNYCKWTTSACTGMPTNSCTPGNIELLNAGCQGETYRQKTCKANCTWDNVSQSCSAPPTSMLAPQVVDGVTTLMAMLSADKKIAKLSVGTCPTTRAFLEATPYAYIEVQNKNPKAVKVEIYNSRVPGGPSIDTLMAVYPGSTIPTTAAERRACTGSVEDDGDIALTGGAGSAGWAGLSGTKAVVIPANSSVQVYFAGFYVTSGTGWVNLNVKTVAVAP